MVADKFPKKGPGFFFALILLIQLFSLNPTKADEVTFPIDQIEIQTSSDLISMSVELALTTSQQAKGLMHRKALPQEQGMLFDFGVEKPILMWMKNTYISLDMIFVGKDGRIIAIEEKTTPMSEKIITIDQPAKAVLEINGGLASQLNIQVGDRIQHSMFE
ncbi:MAG: DUF192 domain-containing protein [Alphaproteobacteria bacterium]|nr:DUF192 domain-containing protein [Alphaproteobacteria bacterium]